MVEGEIEKVNNRTLISCCIDDVKYKYNMFGDEESISIFDEVSTSFPFNKNFYSIWDSFDELWLHYLFISVDLSS